MMRVLIRCLCLWIHILTSSSNVEMNLTRTLLDPIFYDKSVRPARHHRQTTNISFDLSLAQLIDVDEKNQIITTNQWIAMSWSDFKLTWNPLDWDNVSQLHIKYDKVWLPDIVLYNNADNLASLSQISTNVMVSSDGLVTWLSTGIFRSSCSIDVRYFPFDEQNCTLKFASWTYDSARIDLTAKTSIGDLSNLMANSEWEIIRLHVKKNVVKYSCCPETFPDLTYTVQMRRRPLFYVFNMIVPCFLITIVAFLGFCVPSDSGEKVSIGVTTLLSMTVFLMLVAEMMPPNSDSLPLVGVYYLSSIFIVSIATAMSVASLNLYHYGKHSHRVVPSYLRWLFFSILPKLLLMNIEFPPAVNHVQRESRSDSIENDLTTGSISLSCVDHNDLRSSIPLILRSASMKFKEIPRYYPMTNEMKSSINHIYRFIEQTQSRYDQQEHRVHIEQQWQILGRVVDRIFVVFFLIGTILVFVYILGQAPHLRLK